MLWKQLKSVSGVIIMKGDQGVKSPHGFNQLFIFIFCTSKQQLFIVFDKMCMVGIGNRGQVIKIKSIARSIICPNTSRGR